MKIVKIVLIVILVLMMAAAGGLYFFLKTLDLSHYKKEIARKIGAALQTQVTIGDLDARIAWKTGLSLSATDITLDSRGVLSGIKIDVEEIQLAVSLIRLLRGRTVMIEEMRLREPVIHYNSQEKQKADQARKNNFAATKLPQKSFPVEWLKTLEIHSIRIVDGEFVLMPEDPDEEGALEINNIDIKIENLVLNTAPSETQIPESFSIHMTCSALGAKDAVILDGTGMVDVATQQVRLDDILVRSDLTDFSLSDMASVLPAVNAMGITALAGDLELTVSQLILSAGKVPVLTINGTLSDGQLALKALPAVLDRIQTSFEYSNQNLDILESEFYLSDGQVLFKGQVDDVRKTQLYHLDLTLKAIDPAKLIPRELMSGLTFSGMLNGTASLNGGGFQLVDIIKNLSMETSWNIVDGRLENFNLLNMILDKISMIPDLAQRAAESIPEQYQAQMQLNQTVFDGIEIEANVNKGILSYTVACAARTARVKAQGSVDWKQSLTFSGQFFVPPVLTQALVDDIHDLATLVDEDSGEIAIPLKSYQGPLMNFRPAPDMQYLSRTLIMNKARDEVKGLIKGLISGGEEPEASSTDSQPSSESATESSEPDLIDTILDSIF